MDSAAGSHPRVDQSVAPAGLPTYPPVEALLTGRDEASPLGGSLSARFARSRRDPITLLSATLALSVATVAMVRGPVDPWPSLTATVLFLALEIGLSMVRVGRRQAWLSALRYALALGFVVLADELVDPSGSWPFNALMIPVVALAAAQNPWAAWLTFGALVLAFVPAVLLGEHGVDLARRFIAWSFAAGATAIGTRFIVSSLERSRDRLRAAQRLERRRSRQLQAVEAVGEILAREGPTPTALDSVVGLLVDTFGYRLPSLYTWDGRALHLGAQRNYDKPIETFPTDLGVIGRVARTREVAFVPDVTADPNYVAADPAVHGEISVPLLDHGELLGVLNVETGGPRRLDTEDVATMRLVGDRVAVALALGQQRQKLTERARLMDALVSFSESLARSLDPARVHAQVAAGASSVISAEMAILVLRDRESGEFRVVQVEGGDPAVMGVRVLPGEGVTGRAIEAGRLLVDDHLERPSFPAGAVNVRLADTLAAMSTPLVGDDGVRGALSWFREDLDRPFTEQEREVATLLAAQAALAIANAELHHATELAAVTDALTGLNNRRHFDASMARVEAGRRREAEAERRPCSAVVFDLDHFGQVNKLHGHRVGDRILQAFAEVVRRRVRASDLVARYGGEEFVVVLDGASRGEAVRLAEEIRASFETLRFDLPDSEPVGCTVSAGCSALAGSEVSVALLIERADVGLAMAKAAGRNRVVAA